MTQSSREAGTEPAPAALLQAFFQHGLDAMLLTRPDGRILRANQAACTLLGLTEAEAVARGRAGTVVWTPELEAAVQARERTGHVVAEATMRRGDGSTFQAELSSSVILDAGGERYAAVVIRDLTARRAAEAALEEARSRAEVSEQGLRALAARAVDVIWTLDLASGRFLYVSPSIQALRGLTPEEALAEPLEQALTPESLARAVEVMSRIGTGREEDPHLGIYDQPCKDGSVKHVEMTTTYLRDPAGKPRVALGISRDATARVRAERALRDSEAELRLRLEQLDERDRWLQASQRVARLGHYVFDLKEDRWTSSPVLDEVLGIGPTYPRSLATFLALVHPEDAPGLEAYMAELARSGTRFDREYRLSRAGGPPRWVHGLGDLMRDAEGRARQLVGTIQDVTERKEAALAREALAEQLREAQRLEGIGRLAGGVAHDFNNILLVILTCGGEIKERFQAGQLPVKADVDELLVAAERARDLTRQLLAFARRQVVAPVALDLNQAVRDAARLLERLLGEAVELDLCLERELWPITCDPAQLQQVLMNLAVNARDAMPRGGRLTIRTANAEAAPTEGGWHGAPPPPGPVVRLAVEDTGTGIPEEAWPRLFEPFFTTKAPGRGTGLGLATVYGIVQQAGATIRFRSRPQGGSAFEIWWPRSEAPAEAAPAPSPPPRAAAPASGRVLLVEDDDLVRDAAGRALRAAGYEVLAAADGSSALALLGEGRPPPDLLLTDVVMPGLNGREVAEAARRACPGLPVLFMSGYAMDIIVHQGALEPGLDLLQKPFTTSVLLDRVRAALARGAPGHREAP